MIRITREADYGILLMTGLAQADGQPRSAAALAQQRRLPLPMVSKILKALTRSGLLNSQRGAQGGYSLARPATEISAADIISALEGPSPSPNAAPTPTTVASGRNIAKSAATGHASTRPFTPRCKASAWRK
jgi:Rrf2 family protein